MTTPENHLGTPPADHEVDAAWVRRLLRSQHPDLADLPITLVDNGFDNAIFRLGDDLAVRLPRRQAAAALAINEQRWLPELAPRLPIAIPAPLRVGRPAEGYPWAWGILPWLPGSTADLEEPDPAQAERLGSFLRALHIAAPAAAPRNPVRGVPLLHRAEQVNERMQRLEAVGETFPVAVRRAWRIGLEAPIDVVGRWLHGDLHARNLLVADGELSGVIDWGDMTSGDTATDLACLWMLLPDAAARARALGAYGPISDATCARARGWAVLFGVLLLDTGIVDHPQHAKMGRLTLERIASAED